MARKKATGRPPGKPTKKTPQAQARILEVARSGLPLKFAAQAGDITYDALLSWQQRDPEFARELSQARLAAVEQKWQLIQKAAEDRLDADGNLVKAGDWKSLAWSLERAWPAEFARPEIALSLNNNFTQNTLSITISAAEADQIEAQSEPVRQKVAAMFAAYQPLRGRGNGEGPRTVELEAEPASRAAELAPIERRAGDEQRPTFWLQFVSSDGERRVEKNCAIFVTKMITDEVVGRGRGNQAIVAFKNDPITVGEVISVIEKLCGGPSGFQLLQRKAGYVASP
jgi:hypothetical protein